MPDGGLNSVELSRQSELARNTAAARLASSGGFLSNVAESPSGEQTRQEEDNGDENEEDEQDETSMQEQLAQDQAKAALAAKNIEGNLENLGKFGDVDVEGIIGKSVSQWVNHGMLELEADILLPMDVSSLGLTLFLSVPFRIVFCAILGYELYLGITGNKGLIELTYVSFAPPGTTISLPLPQFPLYVAVFAYILLILVLFMVEIGIFAIFLHAWNNPGTTLLTAAKELFPFLTSLIGA